MSHITCDAQRQQNEEIHNCPYRSVQKRVWVYNQFDGEEQEEVIYKNLCGDMEKLSVAQDKCIRCGKIFTY